MQAASRAAPPGAAWSTFHAIAPQDQAAVAEMCAMALPHKGELRGTAARAPFDGIIGSTVAPEGVTFREDQIGGIPGWWCEPSNALPGAAILHLHGGWFSWGSARAYRNLVGQIARSVGAAAFVPDYRLAPEHPFPAAGEDAQACLQGLARRGVRAIAVTGDSAGGNLALSLLSVASRARANTAHVEGAVVLSPVTDLAMTGPSWQSRAEADPYFVRDQADALAKAYLDGHDARDPIASPLYGDLGGLPPIRVHVGDAEVLLDDSVRYVERAAAAGVDARVEVWEGMPHGFIGSLGRLDAAARVLSAVGAFLSPRMAAASTQSIP